MAEQTIDISYEGEEFNEEFPILETVIDNLYKVEEKIGSGGMGFVYKVSIDNIHRLRAKEIIAGTMGLNMLDLKPEDLGLEKEPEGRIRDESVKAKIYEKADRIDRTTRSILKSDEVNLTDTRRITHQKFISDTTAGFRPVTNEDGKLIFAMKVLNRSLSQDKNKVKRLLHEGLAFLQLKHPGLVKSIDVGSSPVEIKPGKTEIAPWYVMEYIEPYNLEEHLELKKPLIPIHFAIPIAEKALSALSHLHEQGIIHRDLKPANIMIEKKSFGKCLVQQSELDLRLSDLGLARFNSIKSESSSADMPSQVVSQEGSVVGTPSYMSPEQINTPDQIGSATDTRSFAATMYHLFTGHVPFGEDCQNAMQIMIEITKQKRPKPMREYNSDVSQTLEDLIMMEFVAVSPKLKKVTKKKKGEILRNESGEIIKVWGTVKDENGRVLYDSNNRLTSEEWELATRDLKETENNYHTDEKLEELIQEKKGEELSQLYFDKLGRMERGRVNEEYTPETVTANGKTTIIKTPLDAEYDSETVEKRISVLEKAIDATENEKRKFYLEKMRFYEDHLPIFKEPEPIVEPEKEPEPEIKTPLPIPKKRSKLKIAAMVAAVAIPVLGIGGLLGFNKWSEWEENEKAYSEISTEITSIEQKIASDEEITKQYFSTLDNNIGELKKQLKQKKRKLSRDDELDLEDKIETLVKSKTNLLNEWILKETRILLDESEIAFSTRNYFEAEKQILKADEEIKQVKITGDFVSYAKLRKEIEDRIKDKKGIIAGKKAALGPLNSATEQYPGLLKTYEKLKADVDDGEPFPKTEEIKDLEKQVGIHLDNLQRVVAEFSDEDENIVDKNFEKTQGDIIKIENDLSKEILFGIAKYKLAELQKLTLQIENEYFSGKATEMNEQAKNLCENIGKIMYNANTSVIDQDIYNKFDNDQSAESTTIDENPEIFIYWQNLAKFDDPKVKEIIDQYASVLSLKKIIADPTKHIDLGEGKKGPHPNDFLYLAKANHTISNAKNVPQRYKNQAIEMYKRFIKSPKTGLEIEQEEIDNAKEAVKQLEQN